MMKNTKNLSPLKNERGMTLVEVIIALGITTILVLVVSAMSVFTAKQQSIAKERADMYNIVLDLTDRLKKQGL